MTIKDIAKESGYAVGTVSRVLNNHPDVSEKARETILAVVEKHHFRLNNNAKHLKQQASKGILRERIRYGRDGPENGGRIGAQRNGHRETFTRMRSTPLLEIQRAAAMR